MVEESKCRAFMQREILTGLSQLDAGAQFLFKQMYSHKNLGLCLVEVVHKMSDESLRNALYQVDHSNISRRIAETGVNISHEKYRRYYAYLEDI